MYPNPFNDILNIKLELSQKSKLNFKLIGILGNEIKINDLERVNNKWFEKGRSSIQLNLSAEFIASGLYIFVIESADKNFYFKLNK